MNYIHEIEYLNSIKFATFSQTIKLNNSHPDFFEIFKNPIIPDFSNTKTTGHSAFENELDIRRTVFSDLLKTTQFRIDIDNINQSYSDQYYGFNVKITMYNEEILKRIQYFSTELNISDRNLNNQKIRKEIEISEMLGLEFKKIKAENGFNLEHNLTLFKNIFKVYRFMGEYIIKYFVAKNLKDHFIGYKRYTNHIQGYYPFDKYNLLKSVQSSSLTSINHTSKSNNYLLIRNNRLEILTRFQYQRVHSYNTQYNAINHTTLIKVNNNYIDGTLADAGEHYLTTYLNCENNCINVKPKTTKNIKKVIEKEGGNSFEYKY